MKKFNIGDVVELKSGSPKMTIFNIVQDGDIFTCFCTWFVNDIKEVAKFNQLTLQLVNDNKEK